MYKSLEFKYCNIKLHYKIARTAEIYHRTTITNCELLTHGRFLFFKKLLYVFVYWDRRFPENWKRWSICSTFIIKIPERRRPDIYMFNFNQAMIKRTFIWEAKRTHTFGRFENGVKTSSVHMTFHFGCISKRLNILMDMCSHFISGIVSVKFLSKWPIWNPYPLWVLNVHAH